MKKMLTVAMTIYKRTRYTDNTIKNILKNKKNPIEFIFLLDNPWTVEKSQLESFQKNWDEKNWTFKSFIQTTGGKINWLWNHVAELATNETILVINDDIEMSEWFDEIIEKECDMKVLNPYYFIPYTQVIQFKPDCIAGHCWAMKKSDLLKILPIDSRIKLRFWDDWIFHRAKEEWLQIAWTDSCQCFHYLSKTCENPTIVEEVRKQIAEDIENRKNVLKEHNRPDKRFIP